MTGICRMIVVPGGEVFRYEGCEGDTYETALRSLRINPDTVLILHRGVSLPQDKPIEEDEVEIVLTSLSGCGTAGWTDGPGER
jgi:sulfur carrier protein ThiS